MKGVLKWVEKIGRYLMRPKSNMQGDAVKTESVRVKRSMENLPFWILVGITSNNINIFHNVVRGK